MIILSLVCVAAPSVSAASNMEFSAQGINFIKSSEGFAEYPYFDNGQWTVGYGTGVTGDDLSYYNRYGITDAQAIKLLEQYVESFETAVNTFIDNRGVKLTQNQFDALVCFTYNLGTNWMNEAGTFRSAVINGTTGNDFIFAITQFCKASGDVNVGLVKRRLCEANMYLNGVYSNAVPANYKYVIYESNLEGATPDISVQAYDSSKTAAIKATVSKSGYRFLGWYTAEEKGACVTSLGSATANTSVLYGRWQQGDGERNTDGTIKGIAVEYSGYKQASATGKVYDAPNGTHKKTVDGDDKLSIVAEYVDSSNVKWGKLSGGGWIDVTAGLAGAPVYEKAESVIEPIVVTVSSNNVNNRVGPGTNYASQGKFSMGQKLTISAVQKGGNYTWGKSESGWIALQYTDYETISIMNSADAKKVTAVGTVARTDTLNVRAGAGTHNARVGGYNRGDVVKITMREKVGATTWGLTEKGWISLYYVDYKDVEEGSVPDIEISGGNDDNVTLIPGGSTGTGTTNTVRTGKIVNCNALRIRSAAGTHNAHIGNYANGTYVNIYETVTLHADVWGRTDKGWISLRYVELDAPTTGLGVTGRVYNCAELRVRASAGTHFAQIGKLASGTKVEILEYTKVGNATWGRISQGWISLYYVDLDAPITNLDKQPGTGAGTGTETTPTEPTVTEPPATQYKITINNATNGRVTASESEAAKGTSITVFVTPETGYELDTLTVKNAAGTALSVTDKKFTMPESDVTITATFKAAAAKYSVNINSAQNGKVTASTTSCVAGTEVVLTASPNAGYELNTLTALNTTTNTQIEISGGKFTMPAGNVNIVATFKTAAASTHKVTVNTSTNGSVSASTTTAKSGDTVTLTVAPSAGYVLDELTVKDASNAAIGISGTTNTRTFVMPASDVTVAATFVVEKHNVTIAASTNGSVSVNPDKYAKGATVTLEIAPNPGYELDTLVVKDASGGVVASSGNKFTMPGSAATVTATFKKSTLTVTVNEATNGTVTSDVATAKIGDTVTLKLTPATNYELDALTVKDAAGNAVAVADNKFTMPATNVTVTATFKVIKYAVEIPEAANGKVTVEAEKFEKGASVTYTVAADEGYEVDTVTVTTEAGKKVTVKNNKFTMPASKVTITATFKAVRSITVTVHNAENQPLKGVSMAIYNQAGGFVEVVAAKQSDSNGKITFTSSELAGITKGMRLVAEVKGQHTYADIHPVRDAVAGSGLLKGEDAQSNDWLDVTAENGTPFNGSFVVRVKPVA